MKINYKNAYISYTDKGNGRTLVFIHGFLCNRKIWNEYVNFFSKSYRVIAVDLIGHGESQELGYIYSMEDMADSIFHLIRSLNLKKISLIGHSMGGYVALAFAELYSEYVKSMILINTTSKADSDYRKNIRDKSIEFIKKNKADFIRLSILNLFKPSQGVFRSEQINQLMISANNMSIKSIIATINGLKSRPNREVLLHFSPFRILMIAGENDLLLPAEEIESEIHNSCVKYCKLKGGHMLIMERETELIEIIAKFLRERKS